MFQKNPFLTWNVTCLDHEIIFYLMNWTRLVDKFLPLPE